MVQTVGHVFVSYCHEDRELVKNLGEGLERQGVGVWVDTRELRGGDRLEKEIKEAIEEARAVIVVLSHRTFNSSWVLDEVRYALEVKKKIIPLLLEGVKPAALKLYFKEEAVAVKIEMGPGGLNEAMPHLLAALEERAPADVRPMLRPPARPTAELVLELTDPAMVEKEGSRRAGASAKLTYVPAQKEEREVESRSRFHLAAPLGPIEAEDLRWYLERYALWPAGLFKERAQKVEKQLPNWGKELYEAVFKHESVGDVLSAWQGTPDRIDRRFTVLVDESLLAGTEEARQAEAREAASLLLSLPWELLHDGQGYLFQGARPVQVRRRLPNRSPLKGTVSVPPIRILLVSPRPEDERAGYIDHRASALPLVGALESLGDLARLTVLSPPTFPGLQEALREARQRGTPFQVVHFDGHGVFDRRLGLGGLCFEDPTDNQKLEERGSQIIDAPDLGAVMKDYRIPLFFLDACQTAQAEEDPTASVAAALLEAGVAAVVAMSHSVQVETATLFVEAFYRRLAAGSRVAEAVLAGQQALFENPFRRRVFGAGRLNLQDWFVPVLFQEQQDLQLVTAVPSGDIRAVDQKAQQSRFADLPEPPQHHFVGRSRELLKLERLLAQKNYALVCGQGGEGKTTLAVELAGWLIRSRRFEQGVFVCVEDIYDVRTVVDRIGRQLQPGYMVSQYNEGDLLDKALQPICRKLHDQSTLILLDNLESLLPTDRDDPSLQDAARFDPEALKTFFSLCQKLLEAAPETRLLFTSRQPLPPPFDTPFNRLTLDRLSQDDAVDLVQKAMTTAGLTPKEDERAAAQPEVLALVETVNCHARSLVLLAPFIGEFGLSQTTDRLSDLMARLHHQYPNERERSLFASLELSLDRLSPQLRSKITGLAPFQGGANLFTLKEVLELDDEELASLIEQLHRYGLATLLDYGFIRFHPALCPYLRRQPDEQTLTRITTRWAQSQHQLADFLYEQQFEDAQLSATLTTLELPNLVHLLLWVQAQGDAEQTVDLATRLEQLISYLGRPRLLKRVVQIRESEAEKLPDWSHTRFWSSIMEIDRLLESGNFPQALKDAQGLLDKCLKEGEEAYSGADYDTAYIYWELGRVLKRGGASQAALPPIDEARQRFQQLADRGDTDAARMASAALTERGDCLCNLGRFDEAAAAYEAGIEIAEKSERFRDVAVGKGQLGTVRMEQGRFKDALEAFEEARRIFGGLGEPASVAVIWHQTGMVYEEAGQYEPAEQAYQKALSIRVQYNIKADEAANLNQLGNLYDKMGRPEEAVAFYRQAVDKSIESGDRAKEGLRRSNIADTLIKLRRFDEARPEIRRAIECKKPFGHAAEPWKTYNILCDLEQAEGNRQAAQQARDRAIDLYLAYRRDGGENHFPGGKLCAAFRQAMGENRTAEMKSLLEQLGENADIPPPFKSLVSKLRAILEGDRDPKLAEDPALDYDDAAEIRLILEQLRQ
jgi:tetratricopeptide (TPR) repeat protein